MGVTLGPGEAVRFAMDEAVRFAILDVTDGFGQFVSLEILMLVI